MRKKGIVNRVGEKYTTTEGYVVEIVKYISRLNCTIKFENGHIVRNVQVGQIILGNIKNPYHKSVYNIGYYGVGEYDSKNYTEIYDIWTSLIGRCYSEKYHKRHITYKNTIVCEEWHNFQNFAKWYHENQKPWMKGWHLDKDILVKGNKIYSPETCCFVPQEINSLFNKRQNHRGDLPIGIRLSNKRYQVRVNKRGKATYPGTYSTIEEAFRVYKKEKEDYIKEVADKWKGLIDDITYIALYKYKVEITD